MAEIELVIRIDEDDFNKMKYNVAIGKPICSLSEPEMVSKVANGIPLPKGHGRLIDADVFIQNESCCGYIEDMDIDYFKQHTPTIIPADTESEEEE